MNFEGMSKEEIYSLREELENKLIAANKNKGEIEEFIFRTFDVPEREKMVGTCYSYNNSYGHGSDIPLWIEYHRINAYNKEKDSFHITTVYNRIGEVCIKNHEDPAYMVDNNYTIRNPILMEEFDKEFDLAKSMLL